MAYARHLEMSMQSRKNILDTLLKKHGSSLNDEAVRTLIADAEAIINSFPLTLETLSNAIIKVPLAIST